MVGYLSSNSVRHLAGLATSLPTIARFVDENWPGATRGSSKLEFVAGHPDDGKPYRLQLIASRVLGTAGGKRVTWTQARVIANFKNDDPPTPEMKAEAEAEVEQVVSALESRLKRDVPVELVQVTRQKPELQAPVVRLAHIAGQHLGKPQLFEELQQNGAWSGTIRNESGVKLNIQLQLVNAIDESSKQSIRIDCAIDGEDLAKIGERKAHVMCEAEAAKLFGSIEKQLHSRATRVSTAHVTASPHQLEPTFYDVPGALDGLIGLTAGQRYLIWGQEHRKFIEFPDTATRAVIEVSLAPVEDGRLEASVSVELQRLGATRASFPPEELANWQSQADTIAEALRQRAAQEMTAPSFSIHAPKAAVNNQMRQQLTECFPNDAVSATDTGFDTQYFALAEGVFGKLEVDITSISEFETRVTFRGDLTGYMLPAATDEHTQSRRAFRDTIARSAAEIRNELIATLSPVLPPSRPDAGLE